MYWRSTSSGKPPVFLEFRSSTVFIVFVVCLAIFTDILFYGLIVPVIPFSLSEQVGVPEDDVQHWTAILLAVYNAALFVGSPIAGFYADHTSSRRLPLLLGLLALCASTLLLCLGKIMALLGLGRILQGLSAAIVWSVGLALLVDTVGKDIGYAMGYVNIAMSVGLLISPVIGGAVYAAAGYYAVYYIAFAVVLCDIALRLVLVEKKVARQWLGDAGDGNLGVTSRHAAPSAAREQPGPGACGQSEKTHERNGSGRPAASPSPTPSGRGSVAETSSPRMGAKRPQLELIKTRRILAVLLGVVLEAGVV
jgi:MFS family permease